jgi:peptide/nickel transport system permease protein
VADVRKTSFSPSEEHEAGELGTELDSTPPPGPPSAAGTAGKRLTGEEDPRSGSTQPFGRPRRRKDVLFWLCLGFIALVVFGAIFANLLPLPNPNAQNYAAVEAGPSLHHLLGTDDLGRDLLSRIVFGSRVSLVVGFGSIAIGMLVGGTLGLIAGYKGGALDSVLNAGSFVILAFPPLLAIIVIVAFWGRSLFKLTLIIGIASIPSLFRVIRATTMSYANRDFVTAARAIGATTRRIVLRELLPNVAPAAISFALVGVAIVVVLEGSLAFLGLSVALPTPSWGNIIYEGASNNLLQTDPLIALWPSLAMFLLLTSLNVVADRLRSRLDVREGAL